MEPTLKFYGGRLGATVPLLFFVIWAISISVAGAASEHGLILGMIGGLTLGCCAAAGGASMRMPFSRGWRTRSPQ